MPHTSLSHSARLLIAGCVSVCVFSMAPISVSAASASPSQTVSSSVKTAPGQPKYGDKGPAVVALQKAIVRNGFTLRGGVDGVFDQRTRKVLRTFQRVVGLKVTGVVDVQTARVLKLNDAPSPSSSTTSSTTSTTSTTTVPAPVYPLTLSTLPSRGMRGNNVITVQKALASAGLAVAGGIDGIFGSGTAATITAFQKSRGLPATGTLDARTASTLGLIAPDQPVKSSNAAPATSGPRRLSADELPTRGDRGRDVRLVQRALVKSGIAVKGGIDGVFGGATAVAIKKFQESVGLPGTGEFDLRTAVKLGLVETPSVQLQVFPVQGPCGYTNTWHAPRSEGRIHLGVDIIAKEGNLLYAVTDGTITKVYIAGKDKRAGNGVRLTMSDGTYFFYGHLSRFAEGITLGSTVRAGQVIGYVGKTGATNTPHLHFEVHPQGGDAIDPTSIVAAVDACDVTTPPVVEGA